jgi:hypothetical protein
MDRFEPHVGLGLLAERVPVLVHRLRRCAADHVLTGEQVDGNDGAHGVMLAQVFRKRGAALDAAAYPLGWVQFTERYGVHRSARGLRNATTWRSRAHSPP